MRHSRPVSALFGPLISPREELADDLCGPEGLEHQRPDADARGCDIDPRLPASGDVPPPAAQTRTYICPGEKHAIPRSIHLARLAAFYPNCRTCEHRHDTGQLPRSMIGRLEETARRFQPESPFRTDGVRGAYLNQLSRSSAAQIAAAVAQRLWSARPLTGRMAADSDPPPARRTAGPAVVIGQDSRPSSADLCVGISAALKRMGCEVIDIGRVSRPCLVFAVEHLQTAAGLYVTGGGCPASWTGLDIVGEGGIPWSMNGTLADIERRMQTKVSRPTRQGGAHRFFDAAVPYRASLLKFYQQVPAVRILGCCAEPAVLETLVSIFETLPCELIPGEVPLSPASGEATSPQDSSVRRYDVSSESRKWEGEAPAELKPMVMSIVAAAQQEPRPPSSAPLHGCNSGLAMAVAQEMERTQAEWAAVIDESGGGVQLFGRNGQPVAIAALVRDHSHCFGLAGNTAPIVVGPDVDEESRQALRELGRPLEDAGEGAEAMARRLQDVGAAMGLQAGGRVWFSDPSPRCDAAVTLGRVLQAIAAVR